jgi:hypothetical protein
MRYRILYKMLFEGINMPFGKITGSGARVNR